MSTVPPVWRSPGVGDPEFERVFWGLVVIASAALLVAFGATIFLDGIAELAGTYFGLGLLVVVMARMWWISRPGRAD